MNKPNFSLLGDINGSNKITTSVANTTSTNNGGKLEKLEVIKMNKDNDDLDEFTTDNNQQIEETKKQTSSANPVVEGQQIEDPSKDQFVDYLVKRKLIIQITNYKNSRLGKYLTSFDFNNLDNQTVDELARMLTEIKYSVSVRTTSGTIENSFKYVTTFTEAIACNFTPLLLSGYSNALNNNENVLDCLTEISLENQDLFYVSPAKRLGFYMVSTAINVHAINSMRKTNENNNLNAPVSNDIQYKFSDL